VKLEVAGMLVKLLSSSKEKGNSAIDLSAVVTGNSLSVGINVFFMREFLEVCKTEEVVIQFINEKSPIVFRMKDFDSHYHIIMPMAL